LAGVRRKANLRQTHTTGGTAEPCGAPAVDRPYDVKQRDLSVRYFNPLFSLVSTTGFGGFAAALCSRQEPVPNSLLTGNFKDTRQRAIVRKLVDQAIAGNLRAMSVLVAVLARTQDSEHQPVEQLSDHDREILENFAQRTAEESEAAIQGGEEGAGMSSDRVLPGTASRDPS